MDSRFHLKAEFRIYGQKFEADMSLNWSGEDGRIDRRITEWFEDCYDQAWAKHCEEIADRESNQSRGKD